MFGNPFTAVMALILLAFVGTLAVFLRIWRELESVRRALDEVRESLQFYAVDAAQQNRDLTALARELRDSLPRDAANPGEPKDACLGELLERGIPNLLDEKSQGTGGPDYGRTPASADYRTGYEAGQDSGGDIFHHLGKKPGAQSTS